MKVYDICILDIYLNFIKDYIPVNTSNGLPVTTKTCLELGGNICDLDKQECEGEAVEAGDGICCVGGDCKEKEILCS